MIRSFADIMEDVKDIICFDVDGIVFDRHVAEAIGISQSNLALHKM